MVCLSLRFTLFVIYEGVDEIFKPIDKKIAKSFICENYEIKNDFLLYVGNAHPRKNLYTLIKAFSIAKKKGLSLKLVLVGVSSSELKIPNEVRDDITTLSYVPRKYLPYFYSASEVFMFLSLYESFGMPLVEAMACGIPIIASNTSCIPEIVGDAGILVNPLDVEEVASTILNLMENTELKVELSVRGIKRASQFTWERTIKETVGI